MLVDINFLETVTNFAKRKNLTRQHVYRLAESGKITMIKIDSIAFILLDEKAEVLERLRKPKTKNVSDASISKGKKVED